MLQGECCSSYAFSTVGAIEGAEALAAGKLTPLSVQNIVDCSGSARRKLSYIKSLVSPRNTFLAHIKRVVIILFLIYTPHSVP